MRRAASALSSTCIRQHTSAYVSIRQHMSAYISIRHHTQRCARLAQQPSNTCGSIRQHTSAYVSIRQHPPSYSALCWTCPESSTCPGGILAPALWRQYPRHTSAYVSIRQHTSAYVALAAPAQAHPCSHPLATISGATRLPARSRCVSIRQHMSAYVSIRSASSIYRGPRGCLQGVGARDGL
jgi:hypothetical protein